MPLIAFSTGRRRMEPRNPLRMHHTYSVGIAKNRITEAYLYAAAVTDYFRAYYTLKEFPTLLAKREIIANAFVYGTGFLPRCRLQKYKIPARLYVVEELFWHLIE